MRNHNRKAGALGFALLGLVTGCTGTGTDTRSIFSMSGASDQAMLDPYASAKEHLNAGRLGNAVAEFRMALAQNPADVNEGEPYQSNLNPHSLEVLKDCRVESSLAGAEPGRRYQFERLGYFCVDAVDSRPDALVFNRTVSLRDTWAKIEKAQKKR